MISDFRESPVFRNYLQKFFFINGADNKLLNICTSSGETLLRKTTFVESGADWRVDGLIAIGFETSRSRCTWALIEGPFAPRINLWDSCYFAKFPDGPHTYTLNIHWLQEEEAQISMSEGSQCFTFTKNVGRGFFLCSTPPTQWTV